MKKVTRNNAVSKRKPTLITNDKAEDLYFTSSEDEEERNSRKTRQSKPIEHWSTTEKNIKEDFSNLAERLQAPEALKGLLRIPNPFAESSFNYSDENSFRHLFCETESDNKEETNSNEILTEYDADWTKAEQFIRESFSKIKEGNVEKDDLQEPLSVLSAVMHHLKNVACDPRDRLWKLMIEFGLVESYSNSFTYCYSKADLFAEPAFTNFKLLNGIFALGTYQYADIREKIVESEVYKLIIRTMERPEIKNGVIGENVEIRRKLIVNLLCVAFNTLRNYPESQRIMRKEGLVQVCLQYLKSEIQEVKALALLVLTFAADLDESSEVIQATEGNINFLIQRLESAMRSETRSNEGETGYTVSYSIDELLESLSRLAKNSNNAIEMMKLRIIDNCFTLLKINSNHLDVQWSLHLVWTLSFLDEGREKLKNHKIIELIQKASKSEEPKISDAAKGILWQLEPTNRPKSSAGVKHVMISYSWAQQDIAKKISEGLKERGMKVWIDVEKMEGKMLEKMAKAVENSNVVICCSSEDYFNSNSCQQEASYANEIQKTIVFAKVQADFKPQGWLGFISAKNIFYHLNNERDFYSELTRMVDYIQKICTNVDETDSPVAESKQNNLNSNPSFPKSEDAKFNQWTADDVKEWLVGIGFQESTLTKLQLGLFTGEGLKELKNWQATVPKFFLEFCQKNLKIKDSKLLVDFSAAVRKL